MMKNKGLFLLMAVTAVAVLATIFDFQFEKKKDEKKAADSQVISAKFDEVTELELVLDSPSQLKRDGNPVLTNKVTLKKVEGQWKLAAPVDELADQEAMKTYIDLLVTEKATEVGGQADPVNWAQFGLDSPKGIVTVKTKDGKSTEVSISSRKNFEGAAYLKRDNQGKVLLGAASWYSRIEKKIFDFRDKRPLRENAADLLSVKISQGKQSLQVEMKDSKWVLADKPKWKIDQSKIREILAKITTGTLLSITSEGQIPGTDLAPVKTAKSPVQILATLKGDKSWAATLAEAPDKSFLIHVTSPSMLATMASVDGEKFQNIRVETLRDKASPFEFKKTEIQKIELRTSKNKVEAEMKDSSWQITSKSDPQLNVDAQKISAFLDRLQGLEAVEFLDVKIQGSPGDKVISFKDAGGKAIIELVMGEAKKKKVNGVDRSLVIARSSLIDEQISIDEGKIKDLGFDELLSPPKEAKPAPDLTGVPGIDPHGADGADGAAKKTTKGHSN